MMVTKLTKPVIVMKLLGLVTGDLTSLDGKYVNAYDPMAWRYTEIGSDAELEAFIATFVQVTGDPAEAIHFETALAATEFWRQRGRGIRPWDGKPNRPLTAFHIELTNWIPE